jgi:predicted nucleic acid-binding protein
MRYLLDTCVFAEYSKLQPSASVLEWIAQQPLESLYISVITVGEIEKGLVRMPPSKKRTGLEKLLESLILRFDTRVISVDIHVIRSWAKLVGDLESKGRVLPILDSIIAATALEHELTVVTRNTDDFAAANVAILDIWK